MNMTNTASMPKLSSDAANKLLANVFDACGQEQNTIPLETLSSYSEYRRERFSLQKLLLIITLLVFGALPLCFIAPDFTVSRVSADAARLPIYEVHVAGKLPINLVSASVENHGVTVYETGNRVFSIEPEYNGTLKIKVTLFNRQYIVKEVNIEGIDNEAPVLLKNEKDGACIRFYVQDSGLGIDYPAVHGETLSGTTVLPDATDEAAGCISFMFPSESLNIFIPDKKGNTLQLVVTVA